MDSANQNGKVRNMPEDCSTTGGGGALEEKEGRLKEILHRLGKVVVAYSGGVDSTLLTQVAVDLLGPEAEAALAVGPSLPRREQREAVAAAEKMGIVLHLVETKEFDDPRYVANEGDRCFWCRSALVAALRPFARARGAALIYGAIPDDLGEDRPGMRAAEEGGMRAPLIEAGLTKADVRELARRRGISVWAKPASACLSSRVTVGLPVTPQRLARIEEAEEGLLALGFRVLRVRDHGKMARIEVGEEEISRLIEDEPRREVIRRVKGAGYESVVLDLEGYRPAGSVRRLPSAD